MLQLTRRDIESGIRSLQQTHAHYLGFKGQTEEAMGAVGGQCISGVAAFGYGVLEGTFGPVKVGPVNADLLGAFLLHGVGFFGYAGRHQGVAHSLAQGLADGFLGRLGLGVGGSLAQKRAHQPVPAGVQVARVSGAPSHAAVPSGGRVVTAAELTALVEQAR